MSEGEYRFHHLKEFFEPRTGGAQGYQPKMIATGPSEAGRLPMFDVDHVVPEKWGGINHPRNYVVMHRSMNRSFQGKLPETKWAYLGMSGLRTVARFFQEVMASKAVKGGIKYYLENEMKDM